MNYDYVLYNAHLIDPAHGIDAPRDIAIQGERIAAVEERIEPQYATKSLDLQGLIISPGLIDAHAHCYYSAGLPKAWAGEYSLQPDYHSFRSGVTTMVDTGSSGSYNFSHFKATVIDRAKTRVLAYVNIADYGMSSLMVEQYPERNDRDAFLACCRENSTVIVGIKIAHYEKSDWKDLEYAQSIQAEIDLPIMVDFGVFKKERPYNVLIERMLQPGDISTHCFRAPVPVLDEYGKVYPYLFDARKRGIKFDLGHGAGSFVFRNAVPALAQGFVPDSISTDLHGLCVNGAVFDLATTLSKLKACSTLSWTELFARASSYPARYLGRDDLGHVGVGAEADLAVWSLREGKFGFADSGGGSVRGVEKLECEMTFRRGELVWDLNARSATAYETLPPLYGLETKCETLVRPAKTI